MDLGNAIIISFYLLTATFAWFCRRPKLAFYVTVALSLVVCGLLFQLRVYLELGGLAHTTPFAVITWLISKNRAKHERRNK